MGPDPPVDPVRRANWQPQIRPNHSALIPLERSQACRVDTQIGRDLWTWTSESDTAASVANHLAP